MPSDQEILDLFRLYLDEVGRHPLLTKQDEIELVLATAITDAPILCFLNNDMEVTSEGWLRELAALAARPDVGVAGATLWFPDGTIQHAGVGFSAQGAPLHLFGAAPRGTAPFYLRSLRAHAAVEAKRSEEQLRAILDQIG